MLVLHFGSIRTNRAVFSIKCSALRLRTPASDGDGLVMARGLNHGNKDNPSTRFPRAAEHWFCKHITLQVVMQAHIWLRDWHPASNAVWGAGMCAWATGAAVNLQGDYHLLELRRRHGKGVHVPTAGLFRFVSCANLFGEVVEWAGYAIACNHWHAYVFAWFTFCNLAARAVHHHSDYLQRFGIKYPGQRRALVPFLL